ncbi:superinfection immunity protein [Pseudomonas putida]|uniref:SHOCT domain-containing protein n=1 Tax=Pseudomonas putida TaxID=303 RepID=A0A6S5U040_PSEPU|nr:superinfection immunity protein [Pseudomonas putida]BBT40995.1 hypothetical protein WP8W18C01_33360 [Pseudomonas putida]
MASESSPVTAFILLISAFVIYFLPTFIAARRGHPNGTSIFLLDLFLGWTGIGWLAALIWSASAIRAIDTTGPELHGKGDAYAKLERLASLKDKGHITPEEYEREKAKLLKN